MHGSFAKAQAVSSRASCGDVTLRPWPLLSQTRASGASAVWRVDPVGEFGFSFVGLAFLLALFVPNIVWGLAARPEGYDASGENRLLGIVERVGQVLTVATALAFADTNLRPWTAWTWWLVTAIVVMITYEAAWVRYFTSRRTVRDFYRSLFGVPLPLATLPVTAFLLLGVYGRLIPLIIATVILGIGHIGIHAQHFRALDRSGNSR